MARVLVVGSANVDFVMGVKNLPQVGETVSDGVFQQTYGGKGANQAIASARAGAGTVFVTSVGRDRYGDEMIRNFAEDGIDVSDIQRSVSPSGSALVMYDQEGKNYLSVAPGANFDLLPGHIGSRMEFLEGIDLLILQREIPEETNRAAAQWARVRKIPVMLNCAPACASDVSLLPIADILVVNENEALSLTGILPDTEAAAFQSASLLMGAGPATVVITLGARGCVLKGKDGETSVPAFRVQAVDTTAAGDTFCGYLGAGMAGGETMLKALRYASAAAALSATKAGAQCSIPHRAEVEVFLGPVSE